jgi:chromosome segregation ATPase
VLASLGELQTVLAEERSARLAQEEALVSETSQARLKLAAAEARNEELISAVPAATRPLLRQIENLSAALSSSKDAFAAAEANLRSRLHEEQLASARAKAEREALQNRLHDAALEVEESRARLEGLVSKCSALEASHRSLKSSTSAAEERARVAETKAEEQMHLWLTLQDERDTLVKKIEAIQQERSSDHKQIEARLASEKARSERLEAQLEAYRQKNAAMPNSSATPTPSSSSVVGANGSDNHNGTEPSNSSTTPTSTASHFDPWSSIPGAALPGASAGGSALAASSTADLLRSLLAQKEGELRSLKESLRSLESSRAQLGDEVVRLTARHQSDAAALARVPELESSLSAAHKRLDAALAVIGEKMASEREREVELEETRQDFAEAKQVFREQIQQLTQEIEQLKRAQADATR